VTDSRRPGTRDRPDTAANPHHENPYTRSSFRSRPQSEGVRWQHRPAAEDEDARSILTSFWAEYVVQETPSGWLLEAARPDRDGEGGERTKPVHIAHVPKRGRSKNGRGDAPA
jgi:hypothetical protein